MMTGEASLLDVLSGGVSVAAQNPYPRFRLDGRGWRALAENLLAADWSLIAQWAEPGEVHAAFRDEASGEIAVASHPCPGGSFISLGAARPGAIRLERAIHDLWGLVPVGLEDQRPWLDHGRWPSLYPLASAPKPPPDDPYGYAFLAAEGEGLHQIPVGPVHAGVIEPGHFRFHAQGEVVVRLEERLGYVHKGLAGLMRGAPLDKAARLAGRLSGDSTVAHALAFARAVEAAAGLEAPPRAQWLRGLMAELERIANHVFDIGAICNDAAFAIMLSHMGVLRERILAANATLFGHRLLMDKVVPGGVAADLPPEGMTVLPALFKMLRKDFNRAVKLYNETPSLLDRTTGTGMVHGSLVHRYGAGGFVGRAASRGHDARKLPGYPPYDQFDFPVPVLSEGDVHARIEIRIAEVRASLLLLGQILADLPPGPVRTDVPVRAGEGLAVAESFRGEVLAWVRLAEDGTVAASHLHDPSWFQWPLLEVAIKGNIVADFPLCNKSFNCSYSGQDS